MKTTPRVAVQALYMNQQWNGWRTQAVHTGPQKGKGTCAQVIIEDLIHSVSLDD